MTYAIEMYFDKETEEKIMSLAKKVADAGLSTKYLEWKTRPHITLAVFNDVGEDRCTELLERFAKAHKAIPAFLESVGMFNETKFDSTGWEWYQPDVWVPHCTVALTSEDEEKIFYQASNLILREFEKTEGSYTSFGLVKITFPVEELVTFDFQ